MNIQKIHVMAIVCCLSFFYRAGTANAESYDLWGKQTRSIPSDPVQKYQGNTITLKKTATITKVEGNALEYTIWRVEPDTKDMLGTQVPVHTDPGTVSHDLQTDMKIEPVADSHVYAYSYRNWNKANWGKYGSLGAGWNPIGGEKRTYLKFDLSGIDPKNVGKATLKLFHYHTGGKNSLSVGIHRVTGTWQEGGGTYHSGQTEKTAAPGEISWVAQPPFSPYQSANFTPGPGANNYIEVDITQLVKQWLSGVPNNGLVLKVAGSLSGGTPESSYGFYSREHTDKSKRPVLIFSASSISDTPTGDKKPVKDYKSIVGVPCGTDREFVYSMFQCIFERDPEKKEVDEQIRDLQNGMSRKDIVVRFFKSGEYLNKNKNGRESYKDAFQAVLGRNPGSDEIRTFPRTWPFMMAVSLFDTEEYQNLCPGNDDITKPGQKNDTPPPYGGSGGAVQGTARLLTAKSNQDMVGRNEMYRGNGTNDAIFRAQFSAPDRTVTAVEVSNTNGLRSVWDTRPNNRLWLGGVVIGGRTMNRPDGSVNFRLGSGQNTLDFFVEDNGSIRGGKTNYRMTIFFASGDPLVMNIIPGGGGPGSSISDTPTGDKKPVEDYKSIVGIPCGTDREFVYSMFQCIFERDPEKKEVDEQVRDLQNGMSRKDIVVRFFKSDEYNSKFYDSKTDGHYWTAQTWNSFYKDVYQAVFGLNRNFNSSVFPKTYHHRVVAQLFDTEEYRNLCPGKGSEYNPLKDPGMGVSDKKQSKDKIDDLIKQYHDQKYPDTKKDNDQKKGAVYDQSPDYTDGSIGDKSTPVEDQKITDKPPYTDVINTPARKCADNVKDAYQQYLHAYNKITQLMQQGENDTPRAQKAYENYKFYKDCYEAVEKTPAPSDN